MFKKLLKWKIVLLIIKDLNIYKFIVFTALILNNLKKKLFKKLYNTIFNQQYILIQKTLIQFYDHFEIINYNFSILECIFQINNVSSYKINYLSIEN